jgi:BirA family biotin operon repressor/biotin-[acetyl-CoA-carboxylase] ligase
MSRPDWPLEDLWLKLAPLWPGLSIEWLPEVDSTNTELSRRLRQGHAEPVLLVAERQTAGRGRLGKSWVTPAGSALTFTLGLPLNPPAWSGLSLAVGVVLAEALDPDGRLGLGLKWPNDLWHWPRPGAPTKLGGILIETLPMPASGTGRYTLVGVGLNVRTPDLDTGGIAPRGLDHWGAPPSPGGLLARVAPPLLAMLARWQQQGASEWLLRYPRFDALAGQALRTSHGLQGVGAGIDADGALLLDTPQGRVRIDSAEVSVRPLE